LLLDPFEVAWMLLKQSKEEQLRRAIEQRKRQIETQEHQLKTNSDYVNALMGVTPESLEGLKRGLERFEQELKDYMGGRGAKEAERKKERTRGKELKRQEFLEQSRKLSEQRQQSAQAKDDARIQAEKDAEDAKRQAEEEKQEAKRIKDEKKREYQERRLRREGKEPEQATAIEDPDAPIESVVEELNRREQAKLGEAKKPPTVQPSRRVAVRRPPSPPSKDEEDDGKEDWERVLEEMSGTFDYDPYGDD